MSLSEYSTSIQLGAVGLGIVLTVKDENDAVVDISGTTVKKMYFEKPDGTKVEKVAGLLSDGKDGKLYYVTLDDDLNQPGLWSVQGYVETLAMKGYSTIAKFMVNKNL